MAKDTRKTGTKARRHEGTKGKPKPINTVQLAVLRDGVETSFLGRDRSTCKALVARGYAKEDGTGGFWITDAGVERAKKKADKQVQRDGYADDPSLMEDLPS